MNAPTLFSYFHRTILFCCKLLLYRRNRNLCLKFYSRGITWERDEFFICLFFFSLVLCKGITHQERNCSKLFKKRKLQYLLKSRMLLNLSWHYIMNIGLGWKLKILCIFNSRRVKKIDREGLAGSHCCNRWFHGNCLCRGSKGEICANPWILHLWKTSEIVCLSEGKYKNTLCRKKFSQIETTFH